MSGSDLEEIVARVRDRRDDPRAFAARIDYAGYSDEQILSAGIACKEGGWESGGLEVAEAVLERLIARSPGYPPAYYELSVVHRYQRRLDRALRRACDAARLAPDDITYALFQAHMFYANGCWDEGDAALARIAPRKAEARSRVAAMRGFGQYLKEFPRERARFITDFIRQRHYWMSVEELAVAIQAAIRERRGFALVRLGDGEGTFARVNPDDERRYADLYRHDRRYWTGFLLGPDFDPTWTGYDALTAHLMPFVAQADVLGVAYWDWIDYEYGIAAERTIPCLLNINRYVMENVGNITLCNQDVHMQLHRTGLIYEIMRDVEQITIPSEHHAPHLSGVGATVDRPHFPQVFWELMHALARPHHGRVFLIAAGTLGKFYACVIKRHGGVALDMGSIVDGWMRLASRPHYNSLFALGDT